MKGNEAFKEIYMLYLVLMAALIAVDQLVKNWTVTTFAAPVGTAVWTADPALPGIPGIVELTRVHNFGAAWSSFSGMRWLLIGVTVVLMGILAYLWIKKIVRHGLGKLSLALILAGGIGNLIDRVVNGYVVDTFNLTFMNYPVFNVADICVVAGAIGGAIYYLWFYEKFDAKKDKKA